MATRAKFGDLLEPGMRKIFFDSYQEKPQVFTQIFRIMKSTKAQETDSSISGFGLFEEHSEAEHLKYEDPEQGYPVTYVHKSYKKGFKVTEELYEDDQYNIINRLPRRLGDAGRRTVENFAAQIINDGFTTARLGGDGKPLFATDHPLTGGGANQSNMFTMDLAEDALQAASLAMRATLDDKSTMVDIRPNVLLVPPALENAARILVESLGRTNTQNTNEINPFQNAYKIVVWDYLSAANGGSDTAWYLIDSSVHELNFFWRKAIEFGQDTSFSTDEALYKAKMRYSAGWSNWRGVFGSLGTNA